MSALSAFKEPDPLNPNQVLQKVLAVLTCPDESVEAYGLDQIEWANGAFSAMAELRKEAAIALFFPDRPEGTQVRAAIWAKFIRMAEDSEWSPT